MTKEVLDTFVERFYDNVSKMEAYNNLFFESLEIVKSYESASYTKIKDEIHKMLDGIHYEMVEEVLEHFENRDGTHGPKWSYEEIRDVVEKHDLKNKIENFDCLIFWYLMNKKYCIHSSSDRSLAFYLDIVEDELVAYGNEKFEKAIKEKFHGEDK
jgi:hypothetical protein